MIKVAQGCLGEDELKAVKEAFDYGYFGHAHKTEEFEEGIAKTLGLRKSNVAAVVNGTAAIHIALVCVGIQKGDEVLVPAMTFVATYQAISEIGAVPVSCDVCEKDLLIDLSDAEKRLTDRTKAIIPVHYCGNPCNMDTVNAFAEKYKLRVIEDAAHCFGGEYKNRKIGSFGDIACFSFDSIKIISCGEGGAVVSGDESIIKDIKVRRMLAMDKSCELNIEEKNLDLAYDVYQQGFRYHMSNINASIGLAQMNRLDSFIRRRREICSRYVEAFQYLAGIELLNIDYDRITPFMFVVKVKNGKRNKLASFLLKNEIETGIKYPPAHLFTLYRDKKAELPIVERCYPEILELPLHCRLSDEDVKKVIATVEEFFKGGRDQ